jgi:hypothetical protein
MKITFPISMVNRIEKPNRKILFLKLRGGIGNQLFIYFAGVFFADRLGMKLVVDPRGVDHNISIQELNLPGKFNSNRLFWRLIKFVVSVSLSDSLEDKSNRGSLNQMKVKSHFFLTGFFQDSYYLDQMRSFGVLIEAKNIDLGIGEIDFKNTALIHIRGGDYLLHSEEIGSLDLEYYKKVRSIIVERGVQRTYIITDDKPYASSLLKELDLSHVEFLDGGGLSDLDLLSSFSKFKYVFLANSTFSWWGAQLTRSDSEVYAPDIWFKTRKRDVEVLLMDHWKVIETGWGL